MRVIGGIYRGRVLSEFEKIGVRPTSDMARESLFNILQFKIAGKRFLDLFCGSGAVGIEALSRGAGYVCFNDFSKESLNLTKKNLEKLGVLNDDSVNVSMGDGVELARRYQNATEEQRFDFVYIDPPYDSDLIERVLEKVENLLKENGVAIFEGEKPLQNQTVEKNRLKISDTRKYGRAVLTFVIKE